MKNNIATERPTLNPSPQTKETVPGVVKVSTFARDLVQIGCTYKFLTTPIMSIPEYLDVKNHSLLGLPNGFVVKAKNLIHPVSTGLYEFSSIDNMCRYAFKTNNKLILYEDKVLIYKIFQHHVSWLGQNVPSGYDPTYIANNFMDSLSKWLPGVKVQALSLIDQFTKDNKWSNLLPVKLPTLHLGNYFFNKVTKFIGICANSEDINEAGEKFLESLGTIEKNGIVIPALQHKIVDFTNYISGSTLLGKALVELTDIALAPIKPVDSLAHTACTLAASAVTLLMGEEAPAGS